MDLFADSFMSGKNSSHNEANLAMLSMLLDNGAEFSQPLKSIDRTHYHCWVRHFEQQVSELRQFPDQIESIDPF